LVKLATQTTDNKTGDVMIQATGLTHFYGPQPAIEDVNFGVRKGEILGFLGPNGAGKTTTMRILTGFMPPTQGKVTVADYDVVEQSLDVRRRVGYLPETVPLHTEMNVTSYLKYMGTLRGMPPRRIPRRIDDVIEVCRLEDYRKTLIGKLSKGFRQRVGIAQAILHEPEVLVMDEPTIGIDPIQVVETRQLIKDLGGEHTLILSTHILPEVSQICERVIVINEGQIVATDEPNNLARRLVGSERVDLQVKGRQQEVMAVLETVEGVGNVSRINIQRGELPQYRVESELGEEIRADLARTVIEHGWELHRLEAVTMSLEEIFLRLTTEDEYQPDSDSEVSE
jgi:ABC-2 type transport system ATP-binding protein